MLTIFDIDLQGSINAGTSSITMHGSKNDLVFGLGSTPKDLWLSDAELGRLSCAEGLKVGSSLSAHIFVDGITNANSDTIATLTLFATKVGRLATFVGAHSSFNKGIVIQAAGGVILSESFTVISQQNIIRGGSGALTIVDHFTLTSTDQILTITADDIDIQATGGISTGTAPMIIATETGKTIGIGTVDNQMDIEAEEFQMITSNGLTIGCVGVNKSIKVVGIKTADSNGVTNTVTLTATVDDSQITFATTASTFYALDARADNGIFVQAQIQTTANHLYLDGDFDNSSSNLVTFAAGQTIAAKTLLSLESNSGPQTGIQRAGALTLTAGTGILILGHLTSAAASTPLVVHADDDSANDDGMICCLVSSLDVLCGLFQ